MAATEQFYRKQKTLDMVFGLSCIAMLVTALWMFADDYNREYKGEQREFRNVEEAVNEHSMLDKMPTTAEMEQRRQALRFAREDLKLAKAPLAATEKELNAERDRNDTTYRTIKASYDAEMSYYNIDIEHKGKAEADGESPSILNRLDGQVKSRRKKLDDLEKELAKAQKALDQTTEDVRQKILNVRVFKLARGWESALPAQVPSEVKAKIAKLRSLPADKDGTEMVLESTFKSKLDSLLDSGERQQYAETVLKNAPSRTIAGYQEEVGFREDDLKRLTRTFDLFAKLASKGWKSGDTFRALPILDAFESPTKIKQVWLPDLTIDYSFKDVPRFDRCVSCHLGIDRANFDKSMLTSIGDPAKARASEKKLAEAELELRKRKASGEDLGFDPSDLPRSRRGSVWLPTIYLILSTLMIALIIGGLEKSFRVGMAVTLSGCLITVLWGVFLALVAPQDPTVEVVPLTAGQKTEFCAHPRLDLFVDPNSPHPMEKFGCTICHSGQGSATDFYLASHTPENAEVAEEWKKEHGWSSNHFWDYPMLPKRFVESSCLKCHHQVTDLITQGSKEQAPKVLRGYTLVRELGCFGCHEISGIKSARQVGPDLRLEPTPALDYLTSAEQDKARSDPLNLPGMMRKVGPSLRRIVEKTNQTWARKWIASPRGFRPDTRMPHYYNLSNNTPSPADGEGLPDAQKKFPDAEIHSIAYYLFSESKAGLQGKDTTRDVLEQRQKYFQDLLIGGPLGERDRKDLQDVSRRLVDVALLSSPLNAGQINDLAGKQKKLQDRVQELAAKQQDGRTRDAFSDADKKELDDARKELPAVTARLIAAGRPVPLTERMVGEHGEEVSLPPQGKAEEGRRLFTERGCLACHVHSGTEQAGAIPPVHGDAEFAPNLSRLAAKINPEISPDNAEAKRRWLVQWVMNPNVHHPRTRMPITHLTPEQAANIAEWLLTQPTDWNGSDAGQPGTDDFVALARVYLGKAPGMTPQDVDDFLPATGERPGIRDYRLAAIRQQSPDADELRLQAPITDDKLKWYIGRKAVGRLGCFGCHDIPGFEPAKPIGTALNDWGKKDPERLAFEDGEIYAQKTYNIVEVRNDPNNPHEPAHDWAVKDGKRPFEKMFFESLEHGHRQREGFLHLKLMNPRSYDYHRLRTWDDRLRMPQFRFARAHRRHGETAEAFEARMKKESEGIYDAQAEFDEAEAREAVMTFILGLTAEGAPAKYLPQPNPDRKAEVRGRQVLDKYNCGGCHQVRPGILEFKKSKESLESLTDAHLRYSKIAKEDYFFTNHNAWEGPAPAPTSDRMTLYVGGSRLEKNPDTDKDELIVRLSEALRFSDARRATGADGAQDIPGVLHDIPAGMTVRVQKEDILSETPAFGGTFANLMVEQYLPKKDAEKYKVSAGDDSKLRTLLPPTLIREGERIQPNWLYSFLLNPEPIRPTTGQYAMLLRMPKFNMSGDEARAIVDYFTAASRLGNPGAGITSQYLSVQEQDPGYWRHANAEYIARLKKEGKYETRLKDMAPVWEAYLQKKIADAKLGLEAAEQAVKDAKDDDPRKKALKDRKAAIEAWEKQLKDKDFSELKKNWEQEEAYPSDVYRMLTNRELCLKCHSIGPLKMEGDEQGPNLALTAARLRPDWVEHWVANPARMFPYIPVMPQNFPRDAPPLQYPEVVGAPLDKVRAARDALMDLPRLTNLPVAQTPAPSPAGGGK
jgi:mono/diheme cytochrome c family protein